MLIDVVIPAFNAERTIADTIRSVFRQSVPPRMILVVDDGSTDGTISKVAAFGDSVTVLRQNNAGPGSARNAGLRASSSEAVIFLDADDILMPASISQLSTALTLDANVVVAFGRAEMFCDGEYPTQEWADRAPAVRITSWDQLIVNNLIAKPGCALIRRKVLLDSGGWDGDASLTGHEDWDLWLRVIRHGKFEAVDEIVLQRRLHGGNLSNQRSRRYKSRLNVLAKQKCLASIDPRERQVVVESIKNSKKEISGELLRESMISLWDGNIQKAWVRIYVWVADLARAYGIPIIDRTFGVFSRVRLAADARHKQSAVS